MNENEGQARAVSGESPVAEPEEASPAEKLEGAPPTGSLTPGAENPESEEIKQETNPNTE